MDVHNAFLHGDLDEDVYMKLPPGFQVSQPSLVRKLQKSIYGLRQALHCWFAKLSSALTRFGFQQSQKDHSLFSLCKNDVHLVVLVYVDDLVIAGNNGDAINKFKQYLHKCFHMKDLGRLKYFLGVEVARSSKEIFLCQRKYALDIITEAGLLAAKLAATPCEENHRLASAAGLVLSYPSMYRRFVGRLIYLCFTRPDLAYNVHVLSQFIQNPHTEHWHAALRVVWYLKAHPGQGILLPKENDLQRFGWCDSDWAGCPLTRRSLTGWFIQFGTAPISWKTQKQQTVSASSAEAEYRSMAKTTRELIWIKDILSSLHVSQPAPIRLHCDSQAALHIAKNPVFHERTKYIEVDCHFVRNEIIHNRLLPSYVPTHLQLADIFTKALGTKQFGKLLVKLSIQNLYAPT
ncbi:uncharacterized protein LOC107647274 [Arachis ipaensis]|uniref:uncharacterized protein LOC107647274 n=1 Tax=Arachis ipaensis TaxID=130454 RepID=UPI0007AF4ED3|nr:uncharacterized protein LOC107647274 [Arachis ipaensis]